MLPVPAFRFLIFFLMVFCIAKSQDSTMVEQGSILEELKDLQRKVFYSKKEADRFSANKEFLKKLEEVATSSAAFTFPFDSLKDISTLSPKNKSFKLVTWNIPKEDESHLFFGFIIVRNDMSNKKPQNSGFRYYQLVDKSAGIKNPETYIGTPDKWFGMLYYQLIECKDYYTLLAWDGNSKLIQRKFIDVLYFKPDGTPVFGKDVFKFPRKNPRRIMFEYSSDVSMSLRYSAKSGMIIYSHLGPREEGSLMQGLPQYYGPDGSFDAMIQKKNKWLPVEDIDARNEKTKNDKIQKPDPKKQKEIYKAG